MSETARVKRLVIKGLFGPRTSTIDITFKLSDRVTVLHGRNGSGKTVTLELLKAIADGDYNKIRQFPFHSIELELTNDTALCITSDQLMMNYKVHSGTRVRPYVESGTLHDMQEGDYPVNFREPMLDEFATTDQVGPDYWLGQRRLAREQREKNKHPRLYRLRMSLRPIKLIRTDRLRSHTAVSRRISRLAGPWRGSVVHQTLMVQRISDDIRAEIQDAERIYSKISFELDQTVAQRLTTPMPDLKVSLAEIRNQDELLRTQEQFLRLVGLLKTTTQPVDLSGLTEQNKVIFHTVLNDRQKKLQAFEKLASKAKRILGSMNEILRPKKLMLDLDAGYRCLTEEGTILPLERLSSGEQHQLVLQHELLFKVAPGTLVLIDEPELSLHPTWQDKILPDLLEIAQLSDLDFLVATHSPYIVGDRHDLMVRLGEPV